MAEFQKSGLNRVKRLPDRGVYDEDQVFRIIDEALVCHVSFVQEGQPFVIPTLHARDDEMILLHGSSKSRLMRHVESGRELCLAFTVVDGLVLARSVFSHSMNYRSVVLFGQGEKIGAAEEKMAALERFTERIMPGRWADARQPTEVELKATSIAAVSIKWASAKIRQGPPGDGEDDLVLPIWAGVVPIRQQFGEPVADARMSDHIAVPDYVRQFIQQRQ